MRRRRFSTSRLDLSHTCCQDGLIVHRSTCPENLVVIRCCTHHHAPPGFLAAPPRTGEHCMLLPRADTAVDVIWRHMMTSSLHVSSHARTSTSALVHVNNVASSAPRHLVDRWPRPTRLGPHGFDPFALTVDFDLGLIDFDFLRWPLTKSQNFRQGFSCSIFRVDSNFELRFFVWSSKIGQLAHSSLWFL